MANLSNINGKFLFTDGDFLKIGNSAPINNVSNTESGISVINSNVASLSLTSTDATGKTYALTSEGPGDFRIRDIDANNDRLIINTSGKVGIGNINPLAKLQITSGDSGASSPWSNADELVLESSGNAGLAFQTPNTGAATIAFQDPESVQAGFIQYLHGDNALRFATNGNNERMRIDSVGNVGIGVTPESWGTTGDTKALQISTMTSLSEAFDGTQLASNFYFDGTNDKYIQSDFATSYLQIDGTHRFRTAASGTADANITWSERMRIDSSGKVTIGTGIINPSIGSDIAITQGSIGLRINDAASAISPTTATANNDNAVDLGVSNIRFRNLYMGGNATFGGNVGIGTTTPNAKLKIEGNGATNGLSIKSAGNGGTYPFMVTWSGGTEGDAFCVDDNLNVGIGTTSPDYNLEVYGTDAKIFAHYTGNSRGGIAAFSGQRIAMTTTAVNDDLVFGYNSAETSASASFVEHMRIDNGTGYVGIGTTSPDAKLSLYHATDDVSINVNTGTGGSYPKKTGISFGATSTSLGGDSEFKGGAGIQAINTASSNNPTDLTFWTTSGGSPTERMRITSGGEIQVGNAVGGSDSDTGTRINATQMRQSSSGTGAHDFHDFYRGTEGSLVRVGNIRTTGTTTAYNTSSDYRLKEDLKDFAGLDMVSKISVYDFKWKTDESRSYGVMAHELQEVLPDAVNGEKDAINEDGSIEPQGVDYSKIVPLLVKSMQELKADNDSLKARIETLENN